jgi:peptide/nickel transport system ATP-binding protein
MPALARDRGRAVVTASIEPLLVVENLRTWFEIRRGVIPRAVGAVRAVDDVSFTVRSKEVLGLAGESGSGKSTIGRSILRLIEPTSGRIAFGGEDVRALGPEALRRFRRKAQIVFQDPFAALDPRMSVAEIVAEPLRVQGLYVVPRARQDRVVSLLESVGLSAEFLPRKPDQMSGGQRQRVVIARALAVDPLFVVADEPVSALDVSVQAQIINLLEDLKERLGLAMLFISHDIAVMEYLSDRIAVIYLGRLMEVGPSEELCRNPKHPYTEALLSAVPDPDPSRRGKRVLLSGDIPSPTNPPSGCVFRTRCPYAKPECALAVPPLRAVAPDRYVACLRDDVL